MYTDQTTHSADCRYCGEEDVTVVVRFSVDPAYRRQIDTVVGGCPACGVPLVTTEEAEEIVREELRARREDAEDRPTNSRRPY